MSILPILVSAALAVSQQTPPPAEQPAAQPAPAAEPAPVAPAPEAAPVPEAMPAPAAPEAAPASPNHWKVSRVEVPSPTGNKAEVHVLKADGTAVTVGEGLADIKQSNRLAQRARALEDTSKDLQSIIGRVVLLSAGGGLTSVGVVAALVGGALWVATAAGAMKSVDDRIHSVAVQGPSILVAGVIAMVIGLFVAVATAVMWAWSFIQGPPAADPAVVASLGSSLAWDPKEAEEAVEAHNRAVDNPAPAPMGQPAPEAAPAPAPAPAPTPM